MPWGMFVYHLKMFQTTLKMSCLCLEGEDGYLHSTTKFIWANSHLIYLCSLPHLINWILPVVILLGRQLRHNIYIKKIVNILLNRVNVFIDWVLMHAVKFEYAALLPEIIARSCPNSQGWRWWPIFAFGSIISLRKNKNFQALSLC